MGKGRKKTPTAILEQRGSWRAGQNPREPRPKSEKPRCPTWVGKKAKKHWPDIAQDLHELKVLGKLDRIALGALCDLLADYLDAREPVDSQGMLIGEGENQRINPAFSAMHRSRECLLKFLCQFGLTPSSRASVKTITEAEVVETKDRFFKSS